MCPEICTGNSLLPGTMPGFFAGEKTYWPSLKVCRVKISAGKGQTFGNFRTRTNRVYCSNV